MYDKCTEGILGVGVGEWGRSSMRRARGMMVFRKYRVSLCLHSDINHSPAIIVTCVEGRYGDRGTSILNVSWVVHSEGREGEALLGVFKFVMQVYQ